MRWLLPPPARTAYFSSCRQPGVVLRVSRILAPVPSIAATNCAVSDAIPDRRWRKLSATRSAESSARALPLTKRIDDPGDTRIPSSASIRMATLGSSRRNALSANATPQTMPFSRATSDARARRSETTVAIVVRSSNAPSSSRAPRTRASSACCLRGSLSVPAPSIAGTLSGVTVRMDRRCGCDSDMGVGFSIAPSFVMRFVLGRVGQSLLARIDAVGNWREWLFGVPANGNHPLDGAARAISGGRRHGNVMLQPFERGAHLWKRGHLHVGAQSPVIRGVESLARILPTQAMEYADLRRNDELVRVGERRPLDHSFRREDLHAIRVDVAG